MQKRKQLEKCMKNLEELQRELCWRTKQKKLKSTLEKLQLLQCELDKRMGSDLPVGRYPVEECVKLPQMVKLPQYTINFNMLDPCGRELLEDALNVRCKAYVPYTNFKVGAAFRTNCGRVFTGCNIENVAMSPGCCAERTALAKGISEGFRCFSAGAVVALSNSGFTTPCGVCRQFIMEFAKKDIPIYIAQAPDPCQRLQVFGDEDEVLVTSIFQLMPMSFTVF